MAELDHALQRSAVSADFDMLRIFVSFKSNYAYMLKDSKTVVDISYAVMLSIGTISCLATVFIVFVLFRFWSWKTD